VTAIARFDQMDVQLNLFSFAMYNQALLGTVFGSASPRVQVPNLLNLFEAGQLKIDEIITQEYTLDQVQQATTTRPPARSSAAWSRSVRSAAWPPWGFEGASSRKSGRGGG